MYHSIRALDKFRPGPGTSRVPISSFANAIQGKLLMSFEDTRSRLLKTSIEFLHDFRCDLIESFGEVFGQLFDDF